MKFFKFSALLLSFLLLSSCLGNFNPNGPPPINYPYFETTEPLLVKNIVVPVGTKLEYNEHFFKEGKQNKPMSESKIHTIEFPDDSPLIWGGIPVTMINKFFNNAMTGYSVYADFEQLNSTKFTDFAMLWQSCSDDIGVMVKDSEDWSFNIKNIIDINSCSVNYQRYFENDRKQQKFLDKLFREMQNHDKQQLKSK